MFHQAILLLPRRLAAFCRKRKASPCPLAEAAHPDAHTRPFPQSRAQAPDQWGGNSFTLVSNHTIFFEVLNSPVQASAPLHKPNRMLKLPMLVFSIALPQTASLTGSVCTVLAYPLCLVTRCTTLLPSPPRPPSSEMWFPCSSLANTMSPEEDVFI